MAGNTKPKYVIDASAVLAILLPDESHQEKSMDMLEMMEDTNNCFISSNLLSFEVFNGIKTAFLRNRITKWKFNKIIDTYTSFPININGFDTKRVLTLAVEKNLTFYDASYLALARDFKAKLISLDQHLKPFSIYKG